MSPSMLSFPCKSPSSCKNGDFPSIFTGIQP